MSTQNASDLVRMLLEHRDGLLGFILALTHDREAAEEIFQEVGLAIVQEAGRRTEVGRFLPWAHEVARRRVAEHYRKSARRSGMEQAVPLDDVVALAFQENAPDPAALQRGQEHLQECLDGLSSAQRDLIESRYRDRTPLRAIAQRSASTEGSIKVLLWRARRQLARCISGKRGAEERA